MTEHLLVSTESSSLRVLVDGSVKPKVLIGLYALLCLAGTTPGRCAATLRPSTYRHKGNLYRKPKAEEGVQSSVPSNRVGTLRPRAPEPPAWWWTPHSARADWRDAARAVGDGCAVNARSRADDEHQGRRESNVATSTSVRVHVCYICDSATPPPVT